LDKIKSEESKKFNKSRNWEIPQRSRLSLFEESGVYSRLLIVVPKVAVKVLAGVVDAGVLQQRDVGVQSLHWHLQHRGKVKTKRK
jgi:hypothetical protein